NRASKFEDGFSEYEEEEQQQERKSVAVQVEQIWKQILNEQGIDVDEVVIGEIQEGREGRLVDIGGRVILVTSTTAIISQQAADDVIESKTIVGEFAVSVSSPSSEDEDED